MDDKKNTGDRNTGYFNTGDWNTGNRNTGNRNTGDWNTGNRNTGNRNTGDWNTGDCNTGYCNTGDCNTGDCNTGYCNTGYFNTGDWNTGNRNTGDWNTGDWNTGDRNTGYCNTITPTHSLIFNKLCSFEEWEKCVKPTWIYFDLNLDLPRWVGYSDLSEEDKKKYPVSEHMGGYLLGGIRKELSSEEKIQLFKESAQKAWNSTTQEDRELTLKLPNFDADVFFEIFGIDVRTKTITVPHLPKQLSEISTDDILKELKNRFIDTK